jgi:hypothetical protein
MKEISLTRGHVALVDDDDYELLSAFKWHLDGSGYASRDAQIAGKRIKVRMHRVLTGLECGDKRQVDHINGNRLDNRRENLRIVLQSENLLNVRRHRDNKSGFKGVSLHKPTGKWIAFIMAAGAHKYLGLFASPELAHAKYCEAAKLLHGEFANNG